MNINTTKVALVGLLAASLIVGCAEGVEPEVADEPDVAARSTADGVLKQTGTAAGAKDDAWNWRNDPRRFQSELTYKFSELPIEGYSQSVAWAATYWPTYEDGINARWQGHEILSPAEKYDAAFNAWSAPEGFMDLKPFDSSSCSWDEQYYQSLGPAATYTSRNKGNWNSHNGVDDDGDGLDDQEECGYGDENKDRDGIETWWGLCHAWVPAAVLEDEPLRPVTRDGVTFEVSDLKGLIIAQYDRSDAYILGGRCNDKDVERDEETGRITTEGCRDVNAGTFHVIMTNFLGIQQRAIAEDRTYNYEVWNQPLTGFKITEQREVSLAEANELLQVKGDEADGSQPDEGQPAEGQPDDSQQEYVYNERAEKFIEIKLTTDYVTESSPSTRPNGDHIERYTRHDHYHYILELDIDGEIIGGEWLGNSIENHPDFLWLPTRARSGNPHIDIDLVRELIAESRVDPDADEPAGEPTDADFRYTSADALAIPDNDPEGAVSTISVAERGVIKGLTLDLDIEHTYRGDLVVELRHDGTTVLVYNGKNDSPAWEDDVSLEAELVTGFEGLDIAGDWELVVSDNARVDTGAIEGWTLDFEVVSDATAPDVEPDSDTDEPTSGLVEVENTNHMSIPDADEAGATSVIAIEQTGTVDQLVIDLDIEHSYAGDLMVTLTHDGTTVTVFDGDQTDDPSGDDVHISDELLEEFTGAHVQGDWELKIVDRAKYDEGALSNWSLSVVTK